MGTIVSTAAIAALKTGLSTQFLAAYQSPRDTVYDKLCSELPSDSKNTLVAIADLLPQMREWVGPRKFNNPAEHSQLVENPHYELSLEVDADDVADSKTGSYFLSAQGLGEQAARHPDYLLATVMQGAGAMIGFDGQYFFDTDHPIDAKASTGSQSNLKTSFALTAANWELIRGIMGSWKAGPNGVIIGARPTHLVVPPQLEGTARRILEAEFEANSAVTASQTNVNKGTAQVVVFDELGNEATTWYPLDLRSVLKPFIYAKRSPVQFVMNNRPNDQGMFENNKVQFGVDGRYGIGIGAWFRAAKCTA